jgi:hypothetical protein
MEAVKETPKTSAPVRLTGADTRHAAGCTFAVAPTPGGEKPNSKLRRQQEIFAWIGIAAIWGTFALVLFVIWVKASDGV